MAETCRCRLKKPVIIFPELLFGTQRLVPAGFQCAGNAPVLRLDVLILSFDAFCFVTSLKPVSKTCEY
jgi:hypothetical protein